MLQQTLMYVNISVMTVKAKWKDKVRPPGGEGLGDLRRNNPEAYKVGQAIKCDVTMAVQIASIFQQRWQKVAATSPANLLDLKDAHDRIVDSTIGELVKSIKSSGNSSNLYRRAEMLFEAKTEHSGGESRNYNRRSKKGGPVTRDVRIQFTGFARG